MNFKYIYTFLFLFLLSGAQAQVVDYHRVFANSEEGDTTLHHLVSDTKASGDIISLLTRNINDENKSLIYLDQDKKGKLMNKFEIDFGLDSVSVIYEADLIINKDSVVYAAVVEVDGAKRVVLGKVSQNGMDNKARIIGGVDLSASTFGNGSGYSNLDNFFDSSYVYSVSDKDVMLMRVTPLNQSLSSKRFVLSNIDGDEMPVTANGLDVAEDSLIYSGGIINETDLYQLVVDSNLNEQMVKSYNLSVGEHTLGEAAIASVTEGRSVLAGYYTKVGTNFGYMIMTDTIGEVTWAKSISVAGVATEIYNVTHALSGDLVVSGKYFPHPDTTRLFSAGLDLDGNMKWVTGYGPIGVSTELELVSMSQTPSGGVMLAANGYVEAGDDGIVFIKQSNEGLTPCSDTIMMANFADMMVVTDTLFSESTIGHIIQEDTLAFEIESKVKIIEPMLFIDVDETVFCPNDTIMELLTAVVTNVDTSKVTYAWLDGSITTDTLRAMDDGEYTVTVTVSEDICYTMCDTIKIDRTALPEVAIIPNTSEYCETGLITLTASVSGGSAPFTFLWGNGADSQDIQIDSEGTYSVTVYDTCGDSATTVLDYLLPENVLTGNISIDRDCENDQPIARLSVEASSTLGNGTFTYLWNTGEDTQDKIVTEDGNYSVTVTDLCGDVAVLNREVEINEDMLSADIQIDNDNFCTEGFATLILNGVSTIVGEMTDTNHSYLWSNGQTAKDITVTELGEYLVTVTNDCGSSTIVKRTLNAPESELDVEIELSELDCITGTQIITAMPTSKISSDVFSYSWNTGEASKSVNALAGVTYTVTVTNSCGEQAIATQQTENDTELLKYAKVFFPGATFNSSDSLDFTFGPVVAGCPDHDLFRFVTEDYEFKIFNRWGQEVFSTNNVYQRWDGRFNGELVPSEVYVWYARYNTDIDEDGNPDNAEPIVAKGDVTTMY